MPVIVLTDANGQKHQVNSRKLILRKAVYGLYLTNNNLLMVKDKISNNWEFPGGGVENNEPLLKTLKREFLEETGLTILDTRLFTDNLIYSGFELFFDINSNEAWKTKRYFFFISKVSGSLITQGNEKDIEQTRFFSINKLPFPKVSQTVKKVLNKFLKLYKEGRVSKINA